MSRAVLAAARLAWACACLCALGDVGCAAPHVGQSAAPPAAFEGPHLCPRSAEVGPAGGCICPAGSVVLVGGCVSMQTADAFCGAGAQFVGDTCIFHPCPDGEPPDVSTGECVATRTLRELAATDHISIGPDETLECASRRLPIVDGPRIACIADEARCPRGTQRGAREKPPAGQVASGGDSASVFECAPDVRCRPGEIANGKITAPAANANANAACTPLLVRGSRSEAYAVDVAAWARAALGPDGGEGSPILCRPLALRASALGVEPGNTLRAWITIELEFPGNDVSAAYAKISISADADRPSTGPPPLHSPPLRAASLRSPALAALPAAAQRVTEAAVRPLVDALRAIGGESTASTTATTIRCAVDGGEHPAPVALPAQNATGSPAPRVR